MSKVMQRINNYTDCIANQIIWKFASKPLMVNVKKPVVSFTFDDVPDSALTNGARILEKHGARGTFYIAGGLAGRVENRRTLISSTGSAELEQRGHEVGCHTFDHHRVRNLDLKTDLDRNSAFLKGNGVHKEAENFAFPYNAAWPFSRAQMRKRYRSCRAGGEAVNRGKTDPLMLKAVEIRQPEHYVQSLTHWLDDIVANPGWLIFFVHDIAERPTRYGCTPDSFEFLVTACLERGCQIQTVSETLDQLNWQLGGAA